MKISIPKKLIVTRDFKWGIFWEKGEVLIFYRKNSSLLQYKGSSSINMFFHSETELIAHINDGTFIILE